MSGTGIQYCCREKCFRFELMEPAAPVAGKGDRSLMFNSVAFFKEINSLRSLSLFEKCALVGQSFGVKKLLVFGSAVHEWKPKQVQLAYEGGPEASMEQEHFFSAMQDATGHNVELSSSKIPLQTPQKLLIENYETVVEYALGLDAKFVCERLLDYKQSIHSILKFATQAYRHGADEASADSEAFFFLKCYFVAIYAETFDSFRRFSDLLRIHFADRIYYAFLLGFSSEGTLPLISDELFRSLNGLRQLRQDCIYDQNNQNENKRVNWKFMSVVAKDILSNEFSSFIAGLFDK